MIRTIQIRTDMWLRKTREDILFWIAKHMPRSVRYYAVVWAAGEATTGQYGNTIVPELTVTTMLQRIEA